MYVVYNLSQSYCCLQYWVVFLPSIVCVYIVKKTHASMTFLDLFAVIYNINVAAENLISESFLKRQERF